MSVVDSQDHPPLQDASDVLRALAAGAGAEGVTVKEAMARADKRGFSLLLLAAFVLLFLPLDIVFPQLAALLLIVCGLGMVGGAAAPWLPGFIGKRPLSRARLEGFAGLFESMAWSQLVLSPRFPEFMLDRALGLIVLALGVLVAPPGMPDLIPSLAVLALAFGLMQRDGLVTMIGVAAGVGWIAFVAAMGAGFVMDRPFAVGWVNEHAKWLTTLAAAAKPA